MPNLYIQDLIFRTLPKHTESAKLSDHTLPFEHSKVTKSSTTTHPIEESEPSHNSINSDSSSSTQTTEIS